MRRAMAFLLFFILLPLPTMAAEQVGISVALIDTGISTAVIDKSSVAEGKNYVRQGYDTEDSLGHGTAVAGLILENAPDATLVPLVYCDEAYKKQIACDLKTVAQMVKDAVDIYNCRVINISAAAKTDSDILREAIAYAEEKGAVVIAAVGNDANDTPYYPASYDTVIGVGAMERKGGIARFSQRSGVSIVAPGEKLSVTLPNSKRATVSGTSYACAFVTAAVVEILEENPKLSPKEVRDLLYGTATDLGEAGFDTKSGYGALNLTAIMAKLKK